MTSADIGRRAIAECVGTFAIVFAGCGAIVVNSLSNGAITHAGISLVFGLVVAAMIYATGHLSGAHMNPAVTLAFTVVRHFPGRLAPVYIIAQCAGAVLAASILRLLYGNVAALGATVPIGSVFQSFSLEIILTALLMFVIMAVATDTRAIGQAAAIAIGGTVALDAMMGGPVSGASMNPARSLGPALVTGGAPDQWLYVVGPVLGAIAGAALYQVLRGSPPIAITETSSPEEVPV